MPKMPRVQEIVVPILRGHNDMDNPAVVGELAENWPGLEITTWGADIDYRAFPFVNIRRVGGDDHDSEPTLLTLPVIEMTAYTDTGLPEAEDLYQECLEALYGARKRQTQTPKGYLHSVKPTMGATQFSSLYAASYRVQGLIRLGVRPPR